MLLAASIPRPPASASTQTTILLTAHHPVDGRLQGPAEFVRQDPPQIPDPHHVHHGDGRGVDLLFTLVSPNLLTALIGSVGLMIAFYYGPTGFACVVLPPDLEVRPRPDDEGRGSPAGALILTAVFVYGSSSTPSRTG